MTNLRREFLNKARRVADVVVMSVAFGAAFVAGSHQTTLAGFQEFLALRIKLVNILLFIGFCAVWILIFLLFGLYRSFRIGKPSPEPWLIAKAVATGTAAIAVAALVFDISAVNRTFLVVFFTVAFLGTVAARGFLRVLLAGARLSGRNLRNLLIVGCGRRGAMLGREIRKRPDLGYLLLGYADDIPAPEHPFRPGREKLVGGLAEVKEIINRLSVEEILIALPIKSQYEEIAKIVELSEELGITVRIPADNFHTRISAASIDYLGDQPFLTLQTPLPSSGALLVKRVLDIAVSFAAIVLLLPLGAGIAVAIKLASKGPILFVQERLGLNRRPFRLLKFRTMVPDAESLQEDLEHLNEVDGAAFKIRNDPRVTRLGRLLRSSSLDELPQLFNVLKGDLSLVGPRPLPARDWDRFAADWLKRRSAVKPGLTCLWQVNGRHEIQFDHWMELDLQYIDNWSLALDLSILLQTIPAVLYSRGAS